MIVMLAFSLLAALAVAGAGGLLFCRRMDHCAASFLACNLALAGLYGLLGLPFIAAFQLALSAGLTGLLVLLAGPTLTDRLPSWRNRWYVLLAGIPFFALTAWVMSTGEIGESLSTRPPMWTVRGAGVPALGRELIAQYTVALVLLGLLLLVGIVTTAYLLRNRDPERSQEEP